MIGGADPLVRTGPPVPFFGYEINLIWMPASRPGGRLRTRGSAPLKPYPWPKCISQPKPTSVAMKQPNTYNP